MSCNAKNGGAGYKPAVGIISLDTVERSTIGSGGKTITYPFPIIRQKVKGLNFEKLYTKDRTFRDAIIKTGQELVRRGAKLVAGGCGYMAQYQKDLAAALDVPVVTSALLQVPFVSALLKPDEKVGILCANSAELDESILEPAGIDKSYPVYIKGLESKEHFGDIFIRLHTVIDSEKIKAETVAAVKEMLEEEPKIKTIVFECSALPAYAYAVQEAVLLPVFDYSTLINFAYSSLVRQ